MITSKVLFKKFKINSNHKNTQIKNLGFVTTNLKNSLTFSENDEFLKTAMGNSNIVAIISNNSNLSSNEKLLIFTKNPRHLFYRIHEYLLNHSTFYGSKKRNVISSSSKIHKSCWIEDNNVRIGKNTIIGPNVCIFRNTVIGNDVEIKSNSVIGGKGFQNYLFNKKLFSVSHAGGVLIKNNVEIGSNTCVDKGIFMEKTTIDSGTKIDNLVHIAHNVKIGKNCAIVANSFLGGSSIIKDNSHIAMSSTIRDQIIIGKNAFVGMGSVVTKNVKSNQTVYGNPARSSV